MKGVVGKGTKLLGVVFWEKSALTNMRDDSNLLEPLLDDGGNTVLIPVRNASYRERLWGILPRSSVDLCRNLEKSIGYAVPCFSHKSTMTEATRPWIRRRTWALILLFLTVLGLFIFAGGLLCFLYKSPTKTLQQLPVDVDRIKGRANTTRTILVVPKNLTLATLLEAKQQELLGAAMRSCLNKAAEEFSEEPGIVKKNARMIIHCNGTRREFLSGKGQNHIEVVWINEKVHYIFDHEASPEVHLARLERHTFPLNLTGILDVLQDVVSQNGSEEMENCLNMALEQFPQEPMTVQDNAKMVVSCGGKNLTFLSGAGENEINVFREEMGGEIQYRVKASGWAWWARFFTRGRVA